MTLHSLAGAAAGRDRWRGAWPDLLAFVVGLAMAWGFGWDTTDLVWSLWLASLVVGYTMLVWKIFGPALEVMARAWMHRGEIGETLRTEVSRDPRGSAATGAKAVGLGAAMGCGGVFMLAFFTVHFGGFHAVHSVFLNTFFPITIGGVEAENGWPGWAAYLEVLRRYWIWLPVAFVAERAAFRLPSRLSTEPADTAVTPEAIGRRKARQGGAGDSMMAPYKNVIRLHLLIFFFAGAQAAGLTRSFAVYAVVYAVYFFPWRLLRQARQA